MKKKGIVTLVSTLALVGVTAVASVGVAAGIKNNKNNEGTELADNLFTVTFDTNGGEFVPSEKITDGEYLSEPTANWDGYEFFGWYSDRECTEKFDFDATPISGNITLYAKWGKKYTVSFDTRGGIEIESVTIIENDTVTVPTEPTKDDYEFAGWFIDEEYTEEFNFETPINQDIILYAKWDEVELDDATLETLFSFKLLEGVSYEIKSYLQKSNPEITSLTLPKKYNGLPVTSVGDSAFKTNYSDYYLTSVTIPTGYTKISGSAFYLCTNLTEINLPEGLTYIGSSAFNGCYGLTSVHLPDSVSYMGSMAFAGLNLVSINIPDSLTTLEEYVFGECKKLKSIIIKSNIQTANAPFYKCSCTIFFEGETISDDLKSSLIANGNSVKVLLYGTDWKYVDGVPTIIEDN